MDAPKNDGPLAAGSPIPVTIRGKIYTFARMEFGELCDLQEQVDRAREAKLLAVIDRLPSHLQEAAAAKLIDSLASANVPAIRTLQEYLATEQGLAMTAYISLRKAHPEIDSAEKAGEIIKRLPSPYVYQLMTDVVGLHAAKNSSSPAADQAPATKPS